MNQKSENATLHNDPQEVMGKEVGETVEETAAEPLEETVAETAGETSKELFVKVFPQFIHYLEDLTGGRHAVLYGVLSLLKTNELSPNALYIGKTERARISKATKRSDSYIKECLSDFVWAGLMQRTDTGVYRINPYLFSTTSWEKTLELRERFVFRPWEEAALLEASRRRKEASQKNKKDTSYGVFALSWISDYEEILLNKVKNRPQYTPYEEGLEELVNSRKETMKSLFDDQKEFIQAYCDDVSVFNHLSPTTSMVFYELIRMVSWQSHKQLLYLTPKRRKGLKKKIKWLMEKKKDASAQETKFQPRDSTKKSKSDSISTAVSRALKTLCEIGLLKEINKSVTYQLSPYHFGLVKGKELRSLRESFGQTLNVKNKEEK